MHLHQLKYFVSIVETGSVTKAAERCFISQPSLSQQLRKLEGGVGRDLFVRAKGKMTLTNAGQILYEHARKILNEVEEAKREVKGVDDTSGGAVAIGILPTLAPFMLPSVLAALAEAFPDATVTIREEVSEVIVAALARSELDLLIEVLPFDESNVQVEPLFIDEFYVAVHESHPLAELDVVSVDALHGTPFILLDDVHCLTRQIQQYCFAELFTPKVLFQASQLGTVKHLIEQQYGVSILPRICIEGDPRPTIRYIPIQDPTPSRQVVLATAQNRYLSPAAKRFAEIVREQYQAASADA
ncbi:MAG: LysR family transcriptional regulator [Pseudomonadales bacterium]